MAFSLGRAKNLFKTFSVPWFLLDETNGQLITSKTIPTSISDRKSILFAENQVPGLNYTPLQPNRNANGTISFSLPIIHRKGSLGNFNLLNQFELLRNQAGSIRSPISRSSQFEQNPEVIYYWGTHRPPLHYSVTQCDMDHRSTLTNNLGLSQYTVVTMTLVLNENSKLYRAWEVARRVSAVAGNVTASRQLNVTSGRPY